MARLTILVFLATLLITVYCDLGKRRGGKSRKHKPVKTCKYLDNCDFPLYPWCLKDFSVADTGRKVLYSRPVTGLLTSGTKKRDRLGSLVLFSGQGEVLELTVEIVLARNKDQSARVFITIFRAMCPDFLAEFTFCDPLLTHEEAYPMLDSCDVYLDAKDHNLTHSTMGFETDGVYLHLSFNEHTVGKLALPHIDCDLNAPRVEITKVGFTNKPRSMARSPMCCN